MRVLMWGVARGNGFVRPGGGLSLASFAGVGVCADALVAYQLDIRNGDNQVVALPLGMAGKLGIPAAPKPCRDGSDRRDMLLMFERDRMPV